MKAAIQLDGVSKRFILHKERARSFQEIALNLLHKDRGNGRREEFWALRDVSFQVSAGETVGLIGPNGAGKSTALKLISRIIEPTLGNIHVNGQVGALLELGAGFHPDLTGRENVYLNGSVLGLSRAQIRQRLDQIVAFAELERFIDVPVKHYSSGMYVRLGFSIAVHTDPDILLVDEVLAVGDATFQRKCLERINLMRREGVTILFVSHNVETVQTVCSRVIWLDGGMLVHDGSAEEIVARYLAHSWEVGKVDLRPQEGGNRRWGSGEVQITSVRLLDGCTQEKQQFHVNEQLVIEMQYCASGRVERPVFGLAIHRSDGTHITGPNTQFSNYEIPWIEGEGIVRYTVDSLSLLEGVYHLSVAVHDWEDTQMFDYHSRLYPFQVLPTAGERYGIVTLGGAWSLEQGGER